LHGARHQVQQGRPAALVRHVQELGSGLGLEVQQRQVVDDAVPRVRASDLARLLPGQGDELLHALHTQVVVHDQQHRRAAHRAELAEVGRFVGQIVVQQGIEDHAVGAGEGQRVAVRFGLGDRHRGDDGLAARAVLDDHVGTQHLGHSLRQRACGNVGQPAGRKAHDEAHGTAGERVLGQRKLPGGGGDERQGSSLKDEAAGRLQVVLLKR
jgi:hypothetical protein